MALEANVLTAITDAVRAALTENPAQDAAAVATAAATAAVAVRASPENIDAISQQIPEIWEEDIEGYFAIFEAACAQKNITQDGTKYSRLLSALTPAVRRRMVGQLPEPGTPGASYATLKAKLLEAYQKSETRRCMEVMAITTLGDRTPTHLLSYMRGLLPEKGDQDSTFFRVIWINALPESVRDHVKMIDGLNGARPTLDALAAKATELLRDKDLYRSVHHIARDPQDEGFPEVNAVGPPRSSGRQGYVCATHARFGANAFRCNDPSRCILKDVIKRQGNGRAGRH